MCSFKQLAETAETGDNRSQPRAPVATPVVINHQWLVRALKRMLYRSSIRNDIHSFLHSLALLLPPGRALSK